MLLFIMLRQLISKWGTNFNTSHVTVYRDRGPAFKLVEAFQYISCYCLSIRILAPFQ